MKNDKIIRILFLLMGYIIIVSAYHLYLKSYSREQAKSRIEQLLLSTKAYRNFVAKEQKKAIYELEEQGILDYNYFHKALLSSSYVMRVANEYYNKELQKNGLDEIIFRQPSINPLNPINQANEFETQLIKQFNQGDIKEYYGTREVNGKEALYYVRPLVVKEQCLKCHDTPESAPLGLVQEYGTESGFGYEVGDIYSAISIVTTLKKDKENANKYFIILSLTTLVLFVIAYILIENMIKYIKSTKSIKEYSSELEERVQERTEELENTLELVKNSQNRLIETEKMASLGGLVAGVAHEINTPLGVSVTAASHLEKKYEDFNKLYKENKVTQEDFEVFLDVGKRSAKIILTNLERAANLISSFKSIAVDQSTNDIREIDLKEYLDSIVISLHPKLKKTTHKIIIECDHFIVNIAAGALSQIITNLIDNALIHAFEGVENGLITIKAEKNENILRLVYKDNGVGMEQEVVEKFFDPFFTTKRSSGGSGLGTHLIYNLVTQSLNGEIKITTKPQEGLQMDITIPLKEDTHV